MTTQTAGKYKFFTTAATSTTSTIHVNWLPEEKPLSDEEYIKQWYASLVYFLRNMANLTQKQLGEEIGMKQSSISRIEKGQWSSLRTMQKILRYFNLNLNLKLVPKDKLIKRSK